MCGITGLLNTDAAPAAPVIVQNMTAALHHRGPDSDGIWTDGPLGFGHRRLSIIDLSSAARQPMSTPDGRYTLTYNGEVYNFRELRTQLEALGHQFRSSSDTEVVLASLAEWGSDALDRFNGMFAFALWDAERRQLLLARDRYGIKPLYYTMVGSHFLFASEVKALIAHPAYTPKMDVAGLVEYFTFQNFFTDRTLFDGVRLLPAGATLRVNVEPRNSLTPTHYWDYSFHEPENPEEDEAYHEELDRLFRQAVNRQLVSDVDVGTYLSGGMDSGSITALAARQLPYIRSFTCGFDLSSASGVELSFDERHAAERMSYEFKTEHYEMVLKAGDMERALPTLAHHLEEPRVGQSYPNFYIAQLASKFVKVVLSGTGGDELFGGYPWRYYRAVVNDDFDHYVDKYYSYWQRLVPTELVKNFFAPVVSPSEALCNTQEIFRNVFTSHASNLTRPEDYINHSLYLEAKTFLHGLLVVEDKLSMAHSLETRVPFLDNDLVDFAMTVPAHLKLGNLTNVVRLNENETGAKRAKYFQRTRDGKLLLRKVMQGYVPTDVVEREKQGFSAPDASWLKGESIDYVRRRICNGEARVFEYLDRDTVLKLVDEHLTGKENRRLLLWSLLNVEQWCECFL